MAKEYIQPENVFARFCVIFVISTFTFSILVYFWNILINNHTSFSVCIFESIFFGLFFGLIITWMTKGVRCAKCKAPMPLYRKPTSFNQMFWGGWTCSKCGVELDRKGNLIKKKK